MLAFPVYLNYNPFEIKCVSTGMEGICMAYKISDACISCGACEPECPSNAISEGDTQFDIKADLCIDCGACADVCPVDAPAPV